jgi:hypothetical protein
MWTPILKNATPKHTICKEFDGCGTKTLDIKYGLNQNHCKTSPSGMISALLVLDYYQHKDDK